MNILQILGNNKRTALMRKNILASFLIKGWTGLIYLLIVPITLKCLGEYENGLWLTISALLIWIDNMDIGLGNGLRNNLASCIAHGETRQARQFVSNTFFMLIFIIVPTLLLLIFLITHTDIYTFLNIDHKLVLNLDKIIITALIFVCSTFIFKFIGNLYLGLQLPAVSNLLVCCGYTLSFVGTYILYVIHHGTLWNIAIINTASPLIVYLISYPYTFFIRYPQLRSKLKDLNFRVAANLFKIGVKFFLLQMSSSFVFLTSSLLMEKLFSPIFVTPYQITYRYFSIILHAFTIICSPYWSATTDAYERKDFEWILDASKKIKKIILGSFAVIILLLILSRPIYSVWIGNQVDIPIAFSIGMALYMMITIYCLAYCYFLNGIGALNIQLFCTLTGAALFFILVFTLKEVFNDALIIIISLCVSNLPSLVCNRVQFYKISHRTAKGIWKK